MTVLIICVNAFSLVFASTASLPAPRLSYLDTNNGLDQDTILDILVDKEGFVWLATLEGLNRFDGVKTLKIHGNNNELSSNAVYSIFEHSSGLLFASTENYGIVSLNKDTLEIKSVITQSYSYDPTIYQSATSMIELSNGDLVVPFTEGVYKYDLKTGMTTELYKMPEQDLMNGVGIRTVLALNKTLLIGSTKNLLALNLDTLKYSVLLGENQKHVDRTNIKTLKKFGDDAVYVGSVEGLYKFSMSEILNYLAFNWEIPSYQVINSKRNIWDIVRLNTSSDELYVATDNGLHVLSMTSDNMSYLFEPIKHYEILSRPDIHNLAVDKSQNIWFGTNTSGAMLWSPRSLLFTNVFNAVFSDQHKQLSHNAVWSLNQHDSTTLFVGTSDGLNKYDLKSGTTQQYLKSEGPIKDYSESEITDIHSSEQDYLWLVTGAGIRYFDIKKETLVPLPIKSEEALKALSQWSYSLRFDGDKTIWTMTEDNIYVIDRQTEQVTTVDLDNDAPNFATVQSFIGVDYVSNNMLVSASSQLWGIDLDDHSWSLLHSIDAETNNGYTFPSNLIRDNNNNAWLTYPGKGLYQLNGKTLSTKAKYGAQNILPSNLVYDITMDSDGDIWFSSHSGIHVFHPDTLEVTSFGFLSGLASSEFNQGASAILSDGRLAFGSNVGFSLFNPSELKLSYLSYDKKPFITEVSLINRDLKLPLRSLNGMTIELAHDDAGLTVNYSALHFDEDANKRFNYRIYSNGEVINYPGLKVNKIILATLAPGTHKIQIYSPGTKLSDSKAELIVKVQYPPFLSPTAYLVYLLFSLLIAVAVYARRKKTQRTIFEANQQVREYNKRLTEALLASSSNIWEWSSASNEVRAERINSHLAPNMNSENMLFDDYITFIHKEDRQAFLTNWNAFLKQDDHKIDVSYRVVTPSGKVLWYRDIGSLTFSAGGTREVKGTYTNLTEKIADQERLKLFGNAFTHTRDWVLIFDKRKRLIATNPSFLKAFNVGKNQKSSQSNLSNEQQELLHRTVKKLGIMKPGERWKKEISLAPSGKQINLLTDFYAVEDQNESGVIDYYLIIATDITEQINAQRELQKLANYDVLTGLINRTLLLERLKQSIIFANRHKSMLAAVFIDLDGFKPINDSFGHIAGDTVLTEISQRLSGLFREQDSVARLGGDEFVVLLEEIQHVGDVNRVLKKVLAVVQEPISIGKQALSVSASIGIAMYPNDATDAVHLLTNADIAMYNAKQAGKNRFEYYTPEMNEKVQSTTILQNRVKVAAAQKEFVNFYQPIIDIEEGKTAGVELLLRWFDNEKMVSPGVFVPIIEQIGVIIDVTILAIEKAISDLVNWYKAGFRGYVAVNLSAKHFSKRPDFEYILMLLDKHNLPVSCLRFEITEGLFVDNSQSTVEYMHEMRALGFKIALDDFGTGYSSLKYIKDFPLDVLKIDRSFVQDVISDKGTESIVKSTLMMTTLLGLDTVAEGIETKEQLQYFKDNKCRYIQGFYFSKPVPSKDVINLLKKDWLTTIESPTSIDSEDT